MEENGNSIVRELLHERNYEEWSLQVKTYLLAQGLWDIVKCGARTPKRHEIVKLKMWRKKNAAALHVIQRSCGEDSFHVLNQSSSAKNAWVALAEKYGPKLLEDSRTEEKEKGKKSNEISGSGHIDDFKRHRPLFDAVGRGNWEAAKTYLDEHPDAVRARIDLSGKSPLHIAVGAGHLHIVEELVQLMTEDDLLMENEDGLTVLGVAVEIGDIAIAKCLIGRNKKLVSVAHNFFDIPVAHAVYNSFHEMARYLYSVTPLEDLTLPDGSSGSRLICRCIFRKLFDIPMDLLTRCPTLAFTDHTINKEIDDTKHSPLRELASCGSLSPAGDTFGFLQRWVYNCIHVDSCATNEISIHVQNLENSRRNESVLTAIRSVLVGLLARMPSILLQRLDVKHIYETKLACAQSLQLLSRICKIIETSDENQITNADVPWAIREAVYSGHVKFIIDITKANPELVWTSCLAREVFMLAIELRQAQVFSLIYGLPDKQAMAIYAVDWSIGGNILHKAAVLPSSKLLNSIPGAALQMQRELQWFKEVRTTIACPGAHLHLNNDNLTPQALFAQEHKKLASDGEKWMKETSSSCTLVGALIVTITFAAAFTFPGGNNQDTGFPLLSNKILFKVFIFADAVSLFSSTTSVLVFLGILTSRYNEEDFSRSLPTKMLVGLSFLFFSIATMMIAFSAAIFIVLQEKWIAILVSSIASVPVAVFVWMQFHLLVDIYMFTYGPSIFNRKVKPWLYDQDK